MPWYQIRVKGQFSSARTDWFDDFTVRPIGEDESVLTGMLADQAALHGVLNRLRDLGVPLIALYPLAPSAEASSAAARLAEDSSDAATAAKATSAESASTPPGAVSEITHPPK